MGPAYFAPSTSIVETQGNVDLHKTTNIRAGCPGPPKAFKINMIFTWTLVSELTTVDTESSCLEQPERPTAWGSTSGLLTCGSLSSQCVFILDKLKMKCFKPADFQIAVFIDSSCGYLLCTLTQTLTPDVTFMFWIFFLNLGLIIQHNCNIFLQLPL